MGYSKLFTQITHRTATGFPQERLKIGIEGFSTGKWLVMDV
jgi:hypothetical protein